MPSAKNGNEIPAESREAVQKRARGRCERCGGAGGHWHHRRSRRVRDRHRHCPCNGVYLCGPCHGLVHRQVAQSLVDGWIVSSFEREPGTVPVPTFWGPQRMTCDGNTLMLDRLSDPR